MKSSIATLLVCGLALAGCPGPDTSDAGDGGVPDTGTPDTGRPDTGTPDTGTPDTGTPDMGTPDTGRPDTGTPDMGTPDALLPDVTLPDASGDAGGFMSFAACPNAGDYMMGATMVTTPGTLYSPRCLTVRVGTMVTIAASGAHPLARGTGGSPASPIPMTATTMPAMLTFTAPGFYPYYCTNHGTPDTAGMGGVIQVIP